jgi:hypothetical protein
VEAPEPLTQRIYKSLPNILSGTGYALTGRTRIRRPLGATSRSELLSMLRAMLAPEN